ncbi:MAG: YggS family pyridoxal phosphate-dependent enzyme [Planctomycetia bacterium]|nr:YggS family pyridoxal phosphate-dependent enzyme [Planctomycetia bacterium]
MTEREYGERIAAVRERMAMAAGRSGRPETDVTLVVVSKYLDPESTVPLIRAVIAGGTEAIFGESRPQRLREKAEFLARRPELLSPRTSVSSVAWHQIGPLQTNKIRMIAPWISRLHSGESIAQLAELNRELERIHRTLPVLLEVNISGETAKHGFEPAQVEPSLERLAELKSLRIDGLMGMTSLNATEPEAHRQFASLRTLAERLRPYLPEGIRMSELSMGMTHDFEIAIEEGATLVRIGSAITTL